MKRSDGEGGRGRGRRKESATLGFSSFPPGRKKTTREKERERNGSFTGGCLFKSVRQLRDERRSMSHDEDGGRGTQKRGRSLERKWAWPCLLRLKHTTGERKH